MLTGPSRTYRLIDRRDVFIRWPVLPCGRGAIHAENLPVSSNSNLGSWNVAKKTSLAASCSFRWSRPVAGDFVHSITPSQLAELSNYIKRLRTTESPFDVVQLGSIAGSQRSHEIATAYATAGATWWVETFGLSQCPLEKVRGLIRDGPPKC